MKSSREWQAEIQTQKDHKNYQNYGHGSDGDISPYTKYFMNDIVNLEVCCWYRWLN